MTPDEVRQPERTRTQVTPSVWVILGFTLLYLLGFSVDAVVAGNGEFLIYIVVMAILIAVVTVVHLRVCLSLGVLGGLSLWGLLHMCGGLVAVPESWPVEGPPFVLYNLWLLPGHNLKYDQATHAFGFAVTTWLCWQALRGATGAARPTFGLVTLCVMASMGFGALNEVIEFTATRVLPKTNVGGYVNTGWDLVSNLTGASVAGVLLWVRGRFRG